VDKEVILRQFDELEEKVERLLGVCKSLETSNSELNNRIAFLEQELQGKVEAENSYTEERSLIRSKIDSLLQRLKDISEAPS
jgi:uncharacterized coiled-coil DUF342 family protein